MKWSVSEDWILQQTEVLYSFGSISASSRIVAEEIR